ncbi:MAG TPA: macro domain-containing protein [Bacteroidota bacterium]|jgi:O-acetyl-ADP-ribose deacetylase (regulator of RNase III)|nr:macro domain-containing protein [Bacteroidota bacterium]
MQFTINRNTISIVRGDISDQGTDAVVNAANNHLWMGAGVAGAIKRKGGEVIEREAVAQGPVDVGAAVITSGGSLTAKHVIHAVVMGQDLHTDAEKIEAATRNSLRLAEKTQLSSVSFPALGTGVGGFSIHHCAKIMLTEVIAFLQTSKHVHLIQFVLFDAEATGAFEGELKMQFSAKRH